MAVARRVLARAGFAAAPPEAAAASFAVVARDRLAVVALVALPRAVPVLDLLAAVRLDVGLAAVRPLAVLADAVVFVAGLLAGFAAALAVVDRPVVDLAVVDRPVADLVAVDLAGVVPADDFAGALAAAERLAVVRDAGAVLSAAAVLARVRPVAGFDVVADVAREVAPVALRAALRTAPTAAFAAPAAPSAALAAARAVDRAAPVADRAALDCNFGSFFAPLTTSLKLAPGLNFGTDVFFNFTVAPVAGLRPVRAGLSRFSNEPKPVRTTRSP